MQIADVDVMNCVPLGSSLSGFYQEQVDHAVTRVTEMGSAIRLIRFFVTQGSESFAAVSDPQNISLPMSCSILVFLEFRK